MRFGDPETQPLLMHLKTDLLSVFKHAANKNLDKIALEWHKHQSLCLVIASNGYPDNPLKGAVVENPDEIQDKCNVTVFYAGVKEQNGNLTANGGRILSICQTSEDPRRNVYEAAKKLVFKDKIYRKDIGETLCKSL